MRIQLPIHINADGLPPFLSMLGQPLVEGEEVTLDFSGLRRVTPAGLVGLVATVLRWRREHHPVAFLGLDVCAITGYLQRMDVLKTCGADMPESFTRHEAKGRFVPVRLVDHRVNEMGHEMASCLAPGGDDYDHPMSGIYDMAWYVLTEIANNARQHSGGQGYVTAQVNSQEGLVRLALADNGKGILKSFQDTGFSWSSGMDDAVAIQKALEPKVSSKGWPANEGVGLTLVAELSRLTRAWLLIVSGQGTLQILPKRGLSVSKLSDGRRFHGTLIGLTFRQQEVRDFADLLHQAKSRTGLLRDGGITGKFKV